MITQYHRPKSMDEAIRLLSNNSQKSIPLGGGTKISHWDGEDIAVVDLQSLGLSTVSTDRDGFHVGAVNTLQNLLEIPGFPIDFYEAVRKETNFNLRQQSTIAGSIVASDGKSPLVAALVSMDALLVWSPSGKQQSVGEYLSLRNPTEYSFLISEILIKTNLTLSMEYIARTPGDRSQLIVAIARWNSGRTRIALGGFGKNPILAFDGPNAEGAEFAVLNSLSNSGDAWASAEYRQDAASRLLRRMLNSA